MKRRRLGSRAAVALTGAGLALAFAPPAGAAAGPDAIAKRRVAFEVRNTNTSGLRCESDGAGYTVRGHLTGPRRPLARGRGRAVTVYLHGFESAEFMWRFKAVPGYDFAAKMARRGHVSLTIDQLGYGASGKPPGFQTCLGSEADVLHQLVGALRAGEYSVARQRAPVAFKRVVSAGSDIGGSAVEIEAYSYDDVDGLILIGYADQGLSAYAFSNGTRAGGRCAGGGEPVEPGGPGGYTYFGDSEQELRRGVHRRTEPEVFAAAMAMRPRSPCGEISSAPPSFAANPLRLGEIAAPVLVHLMRDDAAFDPEQAALQENHFTGSDDVSTVIMEDAGHFPMLERGAARRFSATLSHWLTQRGLTGCARCGRTPRARR